MPEGVGYITRREEELALLAALRNQRQSHEHDWKDIGDHVLSRRVQFVKSDTNRGGRRNKKIIDPTGTLAARTLRSGMMGGITSPAREWKRLTTPDPEVAKVPAVKAWLHAVNEAMSTVFLQSNLYNALPIVYGDIGAFGTSAMAVEEDFTDVIRCYTFPLGSYMLGTDDRNVVNVFAREFQMTVRQLISKFGGDGAEPDWTKFSIHVRDLYIRKSLDAWVDVVHIIRPNSNYNPDMLGEHKFQSVYFEAGPEAKKEGDGKYLREGGYDLFNILAPRWETTSGDVYGTECPGFIAVGGIKALQLQHKRKAQAVEKMINPPMVGPPGLREVAASLLPGSLTILDERDGQKGFRPAHEVNVRIDELRQDMQEEQALIKRVFFEDLFLMLASLDKRQMTAAEVHERSSEKLLALGPVLEQLNQDLLDPLIKITFDIMVRQGLIPEPPEEIQGITLKVEYISIMHQAQKSAGLAGIERFTSFVGEVAAFKPEVLDKLNTDELVDRYAEITGVPPQIVVDADTVAGIREGRAEAQRKEEERIAIQEGARAAKDLSQAEMGGESALDALMEQSGAGALQ